VFSSYIRGQIVLGLLVGAAAWVGLTILDLAGFNVRYAILLAVIAGVTELIPIIGPVIGAIPAIAMGFFDSPTTALAVAILYALIQQLENNFLVPRIVGESVGIHPAILMIVLILFSQFGLLGIILSAPLAAVGRDIFRYVYGRLSDPPRPAGLLTDEPPVIPEHELAPSGGQKTAVTANVQPPAELPTEPTNPDVPPPLPIQQPPPEQEQSATEERPSIASQSQEPL
jgi:hypothetical protein